MNTIDKSVIGCPVQISGILGKIAPKITVTIPKYPLIRLMKKVVKKSVRQELNRRDKLREEQITQAAETFMTDHDPAPDVGEELPPDTVKISQDVLLELFRRRVIADLLDDIPARIANGEISTLDGVREYLKSLT